MTFDVSSAGWWAGIKKALLVVVYVAISGAVAALAAELAKYSVTVTDVKVAIAIMIANASIAGIQKWLSTKK